MSSLDQLDADLLEILEQDPRIGGLELAERLGTTRNTVQARLTRLRESGLLRGFRVDLDLEAVGAPITAFISIGLAQASLPLTLAGLAALPHVLEIQTTTGEADLLVRVGAESNQQLQDLVQQVLDVPGVVRTTTVIALTTPVPYRVTPLLAHLTRQAGRGRATRA
jgi:DNA-binding Lrp family transcriptional regulator